MDQVVNNIVKQLTRRMGTQLEALYLYGSRTQKFYQPEESDINLLAVVTDGASIHALRNTILPLWEDVGSTMRHGPLIAQVSDFGRHMKLNPMFAHHLANHGKLLMGLPDLLHNLPPLDPTEAFARLAHAAMMASAALVPDLLPEELRQARLAQLRRLTRQLRGDTLLTNTPPAQLFAHVQHILSPQIAKLPAVQPWTNTRQLATTSPFLPGLQAIYKETDYMVFVFGTLSPQEIVKTNWQLLAERLGGQCSGLYITTAVQLSLILAYETPLALTLKRYQHQWGTNPIAQLTAAPPRLLRHAARTPSNIQIDLLPSEYLTSGEDEIHRIIHDFQNKLLNVQLEHELLSRMKVTERFTPPAPLPPRTAPYPIRIDAIFNHLGWWADFYSSEI